MKNSECRYEGTDQQTITSASQNEMWSYLDTTLDQCKNHCDKESDCFSFELDTSDGRCKLMKNKATDSDVMEFNAEQTSYFRKCGKVFSPFQLYLI